MPAANSPPAVNRHDEHQLRQFLAARRAGDEAGARRWWDELVTANFDRVRGMVFLESRGRLSPTEQDDATQRALTKLTNNMIQTFKGTSMGEWVNATKTLVAGACIDTQRREQVHSKRRAHLNALDSDGEETGRLDREVFNALEQRRTEEQDEAARARGDADGRAFLDWAVPQLTPKRRAVIELDRAEVPCEDIQQRLGISRDVVYASRSRALKDLAKLRQEYSA